MENNFCKYCGKKLLGKQKFCDSCGKPIPEIKNAKTKVNKLTIVKVFVLALIALIVMFFDTVISSQQGSPTTMFNETIIQYILLTRGRIYPELIIELVSAVVVIISIIVMIVGNVIQLKNSNKTNNFRDILCSCLIIVGILAVYFTIGVLRFENALMIRNMEMFLYGGKFGLVLLPLSSVALLVVSIIDATKEN